MSLTRQTQKVFASNANANQLAVFGTMKTGTPVYSTNLATLQSAAYTQGWSEALLNDKAPYMEEMNAVQYGLSYQIAYMLQEGAFAYDANTTYSSTSIVKAFENGKMYFYHSLIDNNQGHALSDSTYWEKINISDTRNIGEIVQSAIPLTDAGLHLLDGSLLSGSGSYGAFVTYIAGLYTADPTANYFTTEVNWQTAVSTYGVCGKFVYDSTNNTVRLPKYSNKIYTSNFASGAPVIGNGMAIGLNNGTSNIGLGGSSNAGSGLLASTLLYGSDIGTSFGGTWSSLGDRSIGLTTDSAKSGIIADLANITTPLDGYYYIVIATSTKTQIQVDIDEIATDLNGKADVDLSNCTKPHIVETYVNGTSWYRVYSDNWCEQGGIVSGGSNNANISFLKTFADTNYTFISTPYGNSTGNGYCYRGISNITTSGITSTWAGNSNVSISENTAWYACGYIA